MILRILNVETGEIHEKENAHFRIDGSGEKIKIYLSKRAENL